MNTPTPCYSIASPLSNWRVCLLGLIFLSLGGGIFAQDYVAEGEKQLSLNNPTKALNYLEAALAQGLESERLLLDLGLAYQRVGQVANARKSFRQGADLAGPAKKTLLLNLGVSLFTAKDWPGADAAFTEALTIDPNYTPALLNRANTRLNSQAWAGAAQDYRAYQTAAPSNPQKEKIDQLLALLDQAAGDAEVARLAEETRKKKAEEDKAAGEAAALAQKQADEAAAAAEQQRQDDILARIRDSLASASDDSKSLTAGPTGVKSDPGDFVIDP